MSNPISRLLMSAQRRSAIIMVPLLAFALITPMTVSCQRSAADPDSGIEELRGLVRGASGRPAVSELTRIESRYPRTRAAALARFLRGYLYYGAQNYQAAVEALDGQAISATTSIGDYAFFYRAESEAASDAKSGARRNYETVYAKYPDSLKVREARLRAAEMAVALGDPASAIKDLAVMVVANDADASYITGQAHEAM
ncbi:MAG TPA: tetratricopeptide repeat protein, partial [Blastocatellia bacterium]|nr:tetratricopeptide repeat protein [Blastocatellia bacterium]